MDMAEYTRTLRESRMRVANELQSLVEEAHRAHPGEPFTGEEKQKEERLNARLDELEATIRSVDSAANREFESNVATEAIERQVGAAAHQQAVVNVEQRFRDWVAGRERRHDDPETSMNAMSFNVARARREKELIRQGADAEELRSLLWDTGNSGSLVPTLLDRSLYEYLEQNMAMFQAPTTKVFTESGAPMDFPKVTTHGVATQVIAQGTAIGGTDPAFNRMRLDAYKYGQLVQLSNELIQDNGVDVVDFVMRNIARAVGRVIDADFVVGTGTNEPNGIMNAGTANTTTGGSLIDPTYEKLVDLAYSVPDAYASRGSVGWLMKQNTAGVLRKLRDGAGGTVGAPLWQPAFNNGIQNGQPDMLLGYPVYTDVNLAALASNSKSVGFGDFSAYYERFVGNLVIERSDDYAFNTDLVTFRGKWRADGDLIDTTGAFAVLVRNV